MTKSFLFALAAVTSLGPIAADEEKSTNPLSYSYIEGGYLHDNFNANGVVIRNQTEDELNLGTISDHAGGGGAARLSVALPFKSRTIGFHIVSDYHQSSHSPLINIAAVNGGAIAAGIVDTNQKEVRLAFGLHTRFSSKLSWFAEAGLVRNKANLAEATGTFTGGGPVTTDLSFFSGSRTSFDAKIGLRAMVGKHVEFMGYGRYHGNGKIVSDEDGTVGFSGEVKAGVGTYYHFSDRFQVGGDYEFGRPGRLRVIVRLSF